MFDLSTDFSTNKLDFQQVDHSTKRQSQLPDINTLFRALSLRTRNNCFDKIRSILVETKIEKPPNSFLANRLDGFSIYFINHYPAPRRGRYPYANFTRF